MHFWRAGKSKFENFKNDSKLIFQIKMVRPTRSCQSVYSRRKSMEREAVILKKRNIDDLEDLQPTSDPSEDRFVSTPVSTSSTPTAINMPATDHTMSGSILRDISFSESQGDVSIYGHRDWDEIDDVANAVRIPAVDEAPVGHEPADAVRMLSGGDLTAVDEPASTTFDKAETDRKSTLIESGVGRDLAVHESLVAVPESAGVCRAARDERSAADAPTPVTLDEATIPAFDAVVKHLRIQPSQCGAGRRRDCSNKNTCLLRHFEEVVGELLSKYIKQQCPQCTKSFPSKHGLSIHISRMHAVRIPTEHVSTTEEHADIPSAPDNVADCKLFKWGDYDSQVYKQNLDVVYNKVVFWRQNLFKLPWGTAGKAYVKETARLVAEWNSNSNLMDIVLK